MTSSVLRRNNFFTQVLKNSAYRSPAAVASNKETPNNDNSNSLLALSPSTPLYVPVATRYVVNRRGWKWLPVRLGEDHVDPNIETRHSYEQRLRAIQAAEQDETLHRVHDIGFPRVDARARRVERAKELREARKQMKADAELERASRLRTLEVDALECEALIVVKAKIWTWPSIAACITAYFAICTGATPCLVMWCISASGFRPAWTRKGTPFRRPYFTAISSTPFIARRRRKWRLAGMRGSFEIHCGR